MITVTQALYLVQQTASLLPAISVSIFDSYGKVLAHDVHAPIHFPPFNQSAMDGYVISEIKSNSYTQKGIIQAGQDASKIEIGIGETYRIFTGGMVPDNAWAVVRQEDAEVKNECVSFSALPKEKSNIRFVSESVKKGDVILQKNTLLTPAAIGLLTSLGIEKVAIFAAPKIAIISTGDELIPLGQELTNGKIFESNASMLAAALHSFHFSIPKILHVKDDSVQTYTVLKEALDQNDVVLISGGVSVGDYDFVANTLLKIGVTQHFHKVSQKPGKPLFYGTLGEKKIFGLPGNPAAALTLFYIYVLPSLNYAVGKSFEGLKSTSMKCLTPVLKCEPRAQFLKAIAHELENTVELLGGQSSAMLQTFAVANALVYLDENQVIEVGEDVRVYLLE